jgi:hypothetical protein
VRVDVRDNRVQSEAADRDVEWGEAAKDVNVVYVQAHFLVRLAQRRLLHCFVGLDRASRQ